MTARPVRVVLAAVLAVWAGTATAQDSNAELVMVEARGCPWCVKWHRELGEIYPKTVEGKLLPLRRERLEHLPADLRGAAQLRYAPTFVVMECGREIGRITGYGGQDFFWGELGELTKKVKGTC